MSINIGLASDKCQFSNYFPDGITFPARSNIALTKLSTTIPMFSQQILVVPKILLANRGDTALVVCIDGIESNITWTDLFTAHQLYPGLSNVEPNLIATNYFSGFYQYFVNNNLNIKDSTGLSGSKPPLIWVISKAINTIYEFYNCRMMIDNNEHSITIPGSQTLTGTTAFNDTRVRCFTPKTYGLNVSYNCNKITDKTTTNSDFNDEDLRGWQEFPSRLDSTAGGVNIGFDNGSFIDLNGGYQKGTPTVAATSNGKTAWGYSLEGNGFGATDKYYPKLYTDFDDATPIIDIGLQFEEITDDAGASVTLYKIIDGQEQYVHYNGVNHNVETYSIYKPYDAVCQFTNANDQFAILCRRGNIINGSYEYIFDILMGSGSTIENYKIIYTSRKTLNQSAIQIVPVFISTAEIGHRFAEISYILQGDDTELQGDSIFNENNGFINTFRLTPAAIPAFDPNNPTLQRDIRDFWAGIGLEFYNENYATDDATPFMISYNGTPLNKSITWKPSTKKTNYAGDINNNITRTGLQTYTWLGKTNISDFFVYNTLFNSWLVRNTLSTINLPDYLDLHVLNQTVTNFTGSYIGNNIQVQNSGQDKIVGIVPINIDNENISQDVNISYEVYNPYYRPLQNPEAFTTNQFVMELSFKDFVTNQRSTIDTIIGNLKIELNVNKSVRQNIKKITEQNNLVPTI